MIKPALPSSLEKIIEQHGRQCQVSAFDLENFPPLKGAYLLIIALDRPFDLSISTLPEHQFQTGLYVYCGSARGPGGIKARLKRHFAQDKSKHWHIDHMTMKASALSALAVENGEECVLTKTLLRSNEFIVPVKGFGASDCPTCCSHLLYWNNVRDDSRQP